MAKLTDDELLAIIDAEFDSAQGAEGGDISSERAKAWDMYLSKPLGNEIEGESAVVTSDVSDVVDGIMPSLLRIFTTADNLVSFDPVGPEDVAKAEQESDYVNHVFFKQNPAFLILYTWFFDALVQKNGIVKAWWDDSERVSYECYKGLSEAELAELMGDDELEALEQDEEIIQVATPLGPVPQTVYDVKFRRVSKSGRVCVENVPPEEYRISSDARSLDPSKARMVGQERLVKRSDLLAMGFDKKTVDDLPAHGALNDSQESQSRYDRSEESDSSASDPSQDDILVRDGYFKVDVDGDGRAELWKLFKAGDKILEKEEADSQAFHVISPQPLPHKHFGRATAEKVMDVQEVNSTLVRQIMMNLYHTNNPGHAIWEQAIGENTLDDLLTRRVGSHARFTRPVGEAYAPITVPFTAGATFPMLEWWDKAKRDRTGISSDSQGLSPDALKNIQQSVLTSAVDLSKMKIEAIARVFAETGIKSLFLHIQELLLKHQDKTSVVRLRNQWVAVSPSEWRTRFDMTVNIGLGIGTREQNLLHLQSISQQQLAHIQAGLMNLTVTPKNLFNTSAELVKNANLKQPTMFFADPGDKQAPPPSDEQQQLQKMQAEIQARQQQLDARKQELDMQELRLDNMRLQSDHQVAVAELRRKSEADKNSFHVENEKLRNQLTEMELKYNAQVPGGAA
jgi:hypothetical protein